MIKAGQDIDPTDFIITLTAGEALSARDAVYLNTGDGKVYKCDAADVTKVAFLGFAQEAATLNGSVNIVHIGQATGFSGLTVNSVYFLSTTTGAITATAPTRAVPIGVAVTSSVIKINPEKAVQVFTANGTYNIPAWASLLYVEGWGGGASGAAARSDTSSAEASGGGSGGHRAAFIPVSAIGATSVSVTVGQGGAAVTIASGTSAVATNGNDGGNTTFGAFLVANGGVKGVANTANETAVTGGIGGTVSAGNLVVITEAGQNGGNGSSVGTGSATAGGNGTDAGGAGGGAYADASSGNSGGAAGGTSTRAGAGGAGTASYQSGSGQITATSGAYKSGGGGAVACQTGGVASARTLTSGAGGAGLLIVIAM